MTVHTHSTATPDPWQAYLDYSNMLEQTEEDISEAQGVQLDTLTERMLKSREQRGQRVSSGVRVKGQSKLRRPFIDPAANDYSDPLL